MGKQLSFFLAPEDQLDFERALRKSGDVAFLKSWPKSPRAEELPTSSILAMGQENLRILIARREDVRDIEFRPIPDRDEFSCDVTSAPIIEFDRCYVAGKFLRAGRLYRVDKYWDEVAKFTNKPQAFVSWADRLYRLAKAALTKTEVKNYYMGARAAELRTGGVAFMGLDVAEP